MRFGADYYPEHWPEQRWETDARLMRAAGFNVVRMAEFAWAKLEPEEGTYDFDWLDKAISLLGRHGIQTVLGTPTAIPPDWLVARHPDIMPVDERGLTRREGTRRHYRYGSKAYQDFCARIVRVMAAHYSDNLDVIGWQIDNEWGCHSTTYDYSEESRLQFQAWLRLKYESLHELNRRWGTVFWSQTFHTWDAIPLPWYAPADHNPSLMLDFQRWSSDTVADFQRMQIEILRRANPDWFITHNFMGAFDEVDGAALSRDLDFASWDNYPLTTWGGSKVESESRRICPRHYARVQKPQLLGDGAACRPDRSGNPVSHAAPRPDSVSRLASYRAWGGRAGIFPLANVSLRSGAILARHSGA